MDCNDISHIRLGPRPPTQEEVNENVERFAKKLMENMKMPHDRDGKVLQVGDFVHIPCVVTHLNMEEGYCNATLETQIPMPPENKYTSTYSLNTKQVVKV